MRRSPDRKCQGTVSAVRATEREQSRPGGLGLLSADGALKRMTVGFMPAIFLVADASSPSTCRGFKFPSG